MEKCSLGASGVPVALLFSKKINTNYILHKVLFRLIMQTIFANKV